MGSSPSRVIRTGAKAIQDNKLIHAQRAKACRRLTGNRAEIATLFFKEEKFDFADVVWLFNQV